MFLFDVIIRAVSQKSKSCFPCSVGSILFCGSHARWEAKFSVLRHISTNNAKTYFLASHRAWEAQKKSKPSTLFRRLDKFDVVRILTIFVNYPRARTYILKSCDVSRTHMQLFVFGDFGRCCMCFLENRRSSRFPKLGLLFGSFHGPPL